MVGRGIALICLLAGSAAGATKTVVATARELQRAIAGAQPGDVIVMHEGNWKDIAIVLSAAGTEESPIVLRAEASGKVILTGTSSLTFTAPYVVAQGLWFRDGAIAKGSVITFRSDHCRVTDTAITNYNPADLLTAYYWVYFEGSDNRVDRSLFAQKNHMGPLVGNAIKDARRNIVTRCAFRNIGSSQGRNGMEIFRIWGYGGNEELGDDGAFFTIDSNLFDHADGESAEIISLKSNRNRVTNNTIRATLGGITNRSGNFNTIQGNVVLCEGRKGAYGMRVTGQHQQVRDNYIAGCDYGILLVSGEYIDRNLTGKYTPVAREGTPLGRVPRYGWVREIELTGNTLVDNAGADLNLAGNYKSGWPESQRFLIPEDNHIAGNRIVKPRGGVAVDAATPDTNPPLDTFTFKPNRYEDNVFSGGEVRLKPAPEGFEKKDLGTLPPPRTLGPRDVGPRWTP